MSLLLAEPALAGPARATLIADPPHVLLEEAPVEKPTVADPAGLPRGMPPTDLEDWTPSVWERTLYKTITYQTGTNLMDLALFTMLIGGAAGSGSTFLVVNAVSAASLYYAFEYGWTASEEPVQNKTAGDVASKAVLYRAANAGRNLALGFAFGGAAAASTAFMVANFVTDTAVYIGNEMMWESVPVGTQGEETLLVADAAKR